MTLKSIRVARGYNHFRVPNVEDIDHGVLFGLDQDDHLQYHTDTRGDIRYYTKTLLDSGQLDNRYYTESEVDTLLSSKSDTSHTHALTDLSDVTLSAPATGQILYRSAGGWINTDAILIDPAGSVELRHNGSDQLATTPQGIAVLGTADTSLRFERPSASGWASLGITSSGHIAVWQLSDTGTTENVWMQMFRGAGVAMRFNGTECMRTHIQNSMPGFRLVSSSGPMIVAGAGSPESVVSAPVGSLYLRTDSATTLYVKQTGTGNTGWIAK
jgi:hypothetical protein